jgi:uncharacterized membrane protein
MKEIFISIIILLCAIPAGYLLKNLTKEELKPGKKYFKIIWVVSLTFAVISFILPINLIMKQTLIFSLSFISIVSFISWKS